MADIDFKLSRRARDQLLDLLDPLLVESAERIAAACNSESSWGGYHAFAKGRRAGVVAEGRAAADNARSQRMLRNLDVGRL